MNKGDPVCEKRPERDTKHILGMAGVNPIVSPTEESSRKVFAPITRLRCCTCGRPYPRSVSSRNCQCVCGRYGLSVFPPCPAHTASFHEQKASWQVQRCAVHAAVRQRSPPPDARAPLVVLGFLLWLYAILFPEVWRRWWGTNEWN